MEFNLKNNITPRTIEKEITDILERKIEEEINKVDKIAEYKRKYVEKSVLLKNLKNLCSSIRKILNSKKPPKSGTKF